MKRYDHIHFISYGSSNNISKNNFVFSFALEILWFSFYGFSRNKTDFGRD